MIFKMEILKSISIFLIFFNYFCIMSIQSQEVIPSTPPNTLRVGMCIPRYPEHPDGVRDDFCKCNQNVVSCDFSKFNTKNKTTAELRAFWPADTINRICICNSPQNLQIVIAEDFLRLGRFYNVSRVDFFKLDGPLIVDRAFDTFFAGDVYFSNVKFLRTMFAWEYGRGKDRTRIHVDPTQLPCCSLIKTPKFNPPTFYMEDSEVNWVQREALNSQHLWNNIIFENVQFNNMESYAMILNDKDENVSFTNCHFHNMNRTGIAVADVADFLLAHNTFHSSCHKTPVGARSMGSTSSIVFIQNRFENKTMLELDAWKVAIWFNSFYSWDSETFLHINETVHGDRVVSVEYNTVDHYELKKDDISRPIQSYDKIIFKDNLIVNCDCALITKLSMPKLFENSTQRCFTESSGRKEICHLKIKDVETECKNGKPNYPKLCGKNEENFRSFAYSKTYKEVEPFLKSVSFKITSDFINDVLLHIKSPFQTPSGKIKPNSAKSSTTMAFPMPSLYLFTFLTSTLIFLFSTK